MPPINFENNQPQQNFCTIPFSRTAVQENPELLVQCPNLGDIYPDLKKASQALVQLRAGGLEAREEIRAKALGQVANKARASERNALRDAAPFIQTAFALPLTPFALLSGCASGVEEDLGLSDAGEVSDALSSLEPINLQYYRVQDGVPTLFDPDNDPINIHPGESIEVWMSSSRERALVEARWTIPPPSVHIDSPDHYNPHSGLELEAFNEANLPADFHLPLTRLTWTASENDTPKEGEDDLRAYIELGVIVPDNNPDNNDEFMENGSKVIQIIITPSTDASLPLADGGVTDASVSDAQGSDSSLDASLPLADGEVPDASVETDASIPDSTPVEDASVADAMPISPLTIDPIQVAPVNEGDLVTFDVVVHGPQPYQVQLQDAPDGAAIQLAFNDALNRQVYRVSWQTQIGDGQADAYDFSLLATCQGQRVPMTVPVSVVAGPFDHDGDGYVGMDGYQGVPPNGLPADCDDSDPDTLPLQPGDNPFLDSKTICPNPPVGARITIPADAHAPTLRPYGRQRISMRAQGGEERVVQGAITLFSEGHLVGFDISGYGGVGPNGEGQACFILQGANESSLDEVSCQASHTGVHAKESSDLVLSNFVADHLDTAVSLTDVSNSFIITDLDARSLSNGVEIQDSVGGSIQGVELHEVSIGGIRVEDCEVSVSDGVITSDGRNPNGAGVTFINSSGSNLNQLSVEGFAGRGIQLTDSDNSLFTGLSVLNGANIGISFTTSANNTVMASEIAGNGGAGVKFFTCEPNQFFQTSLLANQPNVSLPDGGVQCYQLGQSICDNPSNVCD